MGATLERITRYPVKGLAGEVLGEAMLRAGEGLPQDRRFALVYGTGGSGQPIEDWLDKAQFAGLVAEERLAALQLAYDGDSSVVTLSRDGRQVARGKVDEPIGRTLLTQFFTAYLKGNPRGAPKFVEAPTGCFSEWDEPFLHLINLATARDLERVARAPVDPRRFRANLWLEELAPWEELTWVGRRVRIGEALLEVADKTARCAATMVNPDTAERDLNIPRALRAGYGHMDMGIYLRVIEGGLLASGSPVSLV